MPAFITSPSTARPSFKPPSVLISPQTPSLIPYQRPRRLRATIRAVSQSNATTDIPVGSIVAVQRGRLVDLAQVTGVTSGRKTVDLTLLTPFIPELYILGSKETYENLENIRVIKAEYVPSQSGWIVLDDDLQREKMFFETRSLSVPTVNITPEPKREVDPKDLERQPFPRPSKIQALFGVAACVPISVACYQGFGSARAVYEANPMGEELMSGAVFRQIVLFASGAGAVSALVVALGLMVYAFTEAE